MTSRSSPRGSRLLSALDRYTFDVRGYLLFENALDTEVVGVLRRALEDRALEPGEALTDQRFGWHGAMLSWHSELRDLIDHPLAVSVVRDLIGRYVRLDHAYGIMMRPGTSGLGLHGPVWPFDPAQFHVHRGGGVRSGLLAFSWSLTDGAAGEGGFGCIPGSHHAGDELPAGADQLVVEVPQPAGSLLVFTEAMVHRTLPWQGTGVRWNLLYKYSPGNSAWASGPPAPPDVVDLLTERQRRLLEPPYVGGREPAID